MNTTPDHHTSHQALAAAVPEACATCPENTPLFEPAGLFDEWALQGYMARRSACTLCPAAAKPCLRGACAPQVLQLLDKARAIAAELLASAVMLDDQVED